MRRPKRSGRIWRVLIISVAAASVIFVIVWLTYKIGYSVGSSAAIDGNSNSMPGVVSYSNCYSPEITASQVIDLTNQQRTTAGLPALATKKQLTVAATSKLSDMLLENYWAHNAPDGTPPWTWVTAAGYNYLYAGENLAKDYQSPEEVVNAWMASPGHRANILNPHYTESGVAVGCGKLTGMDVTLVVAEYAAPK